MFDATTRRRLSSALANFAMLCAVLFTASPVQASVSEARVRVLVLKAQSEAADKGLASQVDAVLATAVANSGAYEVLTPDDIKAVLDVEGDRQVLGCDADAECMARLRDASDAELLVSASVGKIGKERVLTLTLMHTPTATARARVSGTITLAKLPDDVTALTKELLGGGDSRPKFKLEGENLSFAVLDLEAAGVAPALAKNLTQVLSTEVKRVEGATVIGRDDIKALLEYESDKQALGCSDDQTSCLAELGDALGVSRIVIGQVGKVGESYVVNLRLIQTEKVVVENRVTETYRGQEEVLLQAVPHAARMLLGIASQDPGTLVVTSPESGAQVFVDGELKGETPLPPIGGLAPGRHSLTVKKDHFFEWQSDVYVSPGATASQWAELKRTPDEFYETWWFWTAATGAGIAAATVAGAMIGFAGWVGYEYSVPKKMTGFDITLAPSTEGGS